MEENKYIVTCENTNLSAFDELGSKSKTRTIFITSLLFQSHPNAKYPEYLNFSDGFPLAHPQPRLSQKLGPIPHTG